MDDKTGPDGLRDDERPTCDCPAGKNPQAYKGHLPLCSVHHAMLQRVAGRLRLERRAHAETRAERDRLRAALEDVAGRFAEDSGHDKWARAQKEPCTCVIHVVRRALLGEVKP
jgi:hypothetical protein